MIQKVTRDLTFCTVVGVVHVKTPRTSGLPYRSTGVVVLQYNDKHSMMTIFAAAVTSITHVLVGVLVEALVPGTCSQDLW